MSYHVVLSTEQNRSRVGGRQPWGQKNSILHGWAPTQATVFATLLRAGAHMGRRVPPPRVLGAHTGTGSATPRTWTPTRGTEGATPRVGAHEWDRMWHSVKMGAQEVSQIIPLCANCHVFPVLSQASPYLWVVICFVSREACQPGSETS